METQEIRKQNFRERWGETPQEIKNVLKAAASALLAAGVITVVELNRFSEVLGEKVPHIMNLPSFQELVEEIKSDKKLFDPKVWQELMPGEPERVHDLVEMGYDPEVAVKIVVLFRNSQTLERFKYSAFKQDQNNSR